MTLTHLLIWACAHIGLVYLMTASVIMSVPRLLLTRVVITADVFASFLYCPACTGFWLGLLAFRLGWLPLDPQEVPFASVVAACMGMGLGAAWSVVFHGHNESWRIEQRERIARMEHDRIARDNAENAAAVKADGDEA